MTGRRRQQ